MEKKLSACTTVLVGKQATIDGSTMAARNDDTYGPLTPQRFVVYPTYKDHPNQVKSYHVLSRYFFSCMYVCTLSSKPKRLTPHCT